MVLRGEITINLLHNNTSMYGDGSDADDDAKVQNTKSCLGVHPGSAGRTERDRPGGLSRQLAGCIPAARSLREALGGPGTEPQGRSARTLKMAIVPVPEVGPELHAQVRVDRPAHCPADQP
jgi:hypothetical protein